MGVTHFPLKKKSLINQAWCCTPLVPGFGRQWQEQLCESKASLVHIVSLGHKELHRKTLSLKLKQNQMKMFEC